MTLFDVTYKLTDAYGRDSRKTFQVDAADIATAQTLAGDLNADLQAITGMAVLQYSINLVTVVAGDTPDATANKDEGGTFQVRKADNDKASVKIPAPVDSIRNVDGTLDLTDLIVTNFFDNFVGGAWRVSDGEQVIALLKGTLDV